MQKFSAAISLSKIFLKAATPFRPEISREKVFAVIFLVSVNSAAKSFNSSVLRAMSQISSASLF